MFTWAGRNAHHRHKWKTNNKGVNIAYLGITKAMMMMMVILVKFKEIIIFLKFIYA